MNDAPVAEVMGGAGLKLDVLTFVLFQAIGEKKLHLGGAFRHVLFSPVTWGNDPI